jgi:osmotically-inducible protein OsmY
MSKMTRQEKETKIKRAVYAVLKRNTFTADQLIRVKVRGRQVLLVGYVKDEDLVYEAVATVESLHPALEVFSALKVGEPVRKPVTKEHTEFGDAAVAVG